jgi:hypothetical protein
VPTFAKLYVQRATVNNWRTQPCDAGIRGHVLPFVERDPTYERELLNENFVSWAFPGPYVHAVRVTGSIWMLRSGAE